MMSVDNGVRRSKKPLATVTIEPVGPRSADPREHWISLIFTLAAIEPRHADRRHVSTLALEALAGLRSDAGEPDQRRVNEVSTARRTSKPGGASPAHTVTGLEATSVSRGRPPAEAVAGLCGVLEGDGYRVSIREKRQCSEPGCPTQSVIDWDALNRAVPPRWYSGTICDAHNYRTCLRCASVHVLSSVSTSGPAPSVHCEVCGLVIIEWGSSKIWTAKLVAKGPDAAGG